MKKNIIQKYLDGEINLSDNYTYDELLVIAQLDVMAYAEIHLTIMPYSQHSFYKKLNDNVGVPEKFDLLVSIMKPTLEGVSDDGINELTEILIVKSLNRLPKPRRIRLHGKIKTVENRDAYVFELHNGIDGRWKYFCYHTELKYDKTLSTYYRTISRCIHKIYLGYYYLLVDRKNGHSVIARAVFSEDIRDIIFDHDDVFDYTFRTSDDVYYFKTKSECLETQKNLLGLGNEKKYYPKISRW